MNLELNEEQKLLQKTVREFAETEVRPLAKELDETGRFPRELFKKAAELGLTVGIGTATKADKVTVRWPGKDAGTETWTNLESGKTHPLEQGNAK